MLIKLQIIELNDKLSKILNDQDPPITIFFLQELQTVFPELSKDLHYNNLSSIDKTKKFFSIKDNQKLNIILDTIKSENLRTKNYLKQIQSKLNELASNATIENKSNQEEIVKCLKTCQEYQQKIKSNETNIDRSNIIFLNKIDQYKNIIDSDNIQSLYILYIKTTVLIVI